MPLFLPFFLHWLGSPCSLSFSAKKGHTLQNRSTNRTESLEPAWLLGFSVLFSNTTQYNVLGKVEQNHLAYHF